MTMGFDKPRPGAFPDVKPGDTVHFEFRKKGEGLGARVGAPDGRRAVIAALIRWSVANRVLVLFAAAFLAAAALFSVASTPVDALPDLSDTQVIVRTTWAGKPPQVVEDLVTYPLTTTMLSVPGAKTVRGYSFFGDSFVYILFDDRTDPYWARSRVVEYLNQVQSRLPAGATSALGPDATGVGWVYEYALVDRTGGTDLGQLRALNDWFLKFELKTVPDVAEVASIGGMVRQYQVVLDPDRMRQLGVTQRIVMEALQNANQSSGGSVVELAETEYMVRSQSFLKTLDDFRGIPLALSGATRSCCATSPSSRSARRCAGASPSSTAKARSRAASSSCARARTRAPRSPR
jgi:Cu(I)/Ag(I) efflux system membrane protein CusA/SilA